jgi:hypothetical protein
VRRQRCGGAAGQQATSAGRRGDGRKHALDRSELGLQATADDGVHGIARLAAKYTIGERQLCGIVGQRRAHQVETGKDQAAAKHPVGIEQVDRGRGAGANHQARVLKSARAPISAAQRSAPSCPGNS